MEIANPRRILAVALAESQEHLSRVLKDLSGTQPAASAATGRLAGTTHTLALTTAYYQAQVPVWIDLVGGQKEEEEGTSSPPANPDLDDDDDDDPDPTTPRQWADAFLGADARDVRAALGGVVAVVVVDGAAAGRPRAFIEQVGRLVRGLGRVEGGGEDSDNDDNDDGLYDSWDGVALVAGVVAPGAAAAAAAVVDEWDDVCAAAGLEFVLVGGGSGSTERNEFGEATGLPRVLEALQANDWVGGDDLDGFLDDDDADGDADVDGDSDAAFDPDRLEYGFDRADFAGLREAIWRGGDVGEAAAARDAEDEEDGGPDGPDGPDDPDDPGDLAALMHKLLAVREQGAGLPAAQRRRLAAAAVGEVMRSL